MRTVYGWVCTVPGCMLVVLHTPPAPGLVRPCPGGGYIVDRTSLQLSTWQTRAAVGTRTRPGPMFECAIPLTPCRGIGCSRAPLV